eukprot:6199128-Pleurochrysis_carterae.AAC.2
MNLAHKGGLAVACGGGDETRLTARAARQRSAIARVCAWLRRAIQNETNRQNTVAYSTNS